jgi:hypothetical protein
MKCDESLNLLSDFHDRALDDVARSQVHAHLSECPPCADIFGELGEIVKTAVMLNREPEINFPDQDAFWRRMKIMGPQIH